MMTSADLASYAGIVGGAIAIIVAGWKAVRMLSRGLRRIGNFLDDWFGEPARPGQERRLGFPERLAEVEKRTAQLLPNGGAHMSDRVKRIEDNLCDLSAKVDHLVEKANKRNGRTSG